MEKSKKFLSNQLMSTKTVLKQLFSFTISAIIIFIVGCGGNEIISHLNSFERFVNKVSKESHSYKSRDWEKADAQFEKFVIQGYEVYGDELTEEERIRMGNLTGRYIALRLISGYGNVMDIFGDLENVLEGLIEGFDMELDRVDIEDIFGEK